MRTLGVAALCLGVLTALMQPAFAQECAPDKLGLARTVAINASSSPYVGSHGGKGPALLAQGEVALTFDDGPSRAYTRPILAALAAQCTKATFFMVGRMAAADPEMVREVARQGHTVGTHTWSHANLQALSQNQVEEEIELGFSVVQQALGRPVAPFFRYPYLRETPFTRGYLKSRQMAAFSIDIDSRDFETRDANVLYERVLRELSARGKGIILFHDIHASTARALPRILAELKARGFRIVQPIPKAGLETVAEYDARARHLIDRKRLAAASNPLSKRAVAWPAAVPPEVKAPPVQAQAPAPAPSKHGTYDWDANAWQQ